MCADGFDDCDHVLRITSVHCEQCRINETETFLDHSELLLFLIGKTHNVMDRRHEANGCSLWTVRRS